MSLVPSNTFFYDSQSGSYNNLAGKYAENWHTHIPDMRHHQKVREALLRWDYNLIMDGEKRQGVFAFFGPGFSITERDIGKEYVAGMLEYFESVLAVDWSTDVLSNFFSCIQTESRRVGEKVQCTQRDLSHGLSARFHAIVQDKIDCVNTVQELHDFFAFLDQLTIDAVMQVALTASPNQQVNPHVSQLQIQEPLNFASVLQSGLEIRRAFASLFFTGMVAETERVIRAEIEIYKKELSTSEMSAMLQSCHHFVAELNYVNGHRFIAELLRHNPRAHLIMPTDVDAVYEDIGSFPRLDVQRLQTELAKFDIDLNVSRQWTMDDSHEFPPHSHTIQVLKASSKTA